MDYIIHNIVLVRPGKQQESFEGSIRRKIRQLEKVLQDYKEQMILEIFLYADENASHRIALSLPMKNKTLTVDGESKSEPWSIEELMDQLGEMIQKQLSAERKETRRSHAAVHN
jgi:ribosome-associated translation inhibitor RaiA